MSESEYLITHARVATFGEEPELLADGALLVTDGRIADLGDSVELSTRYPQAERWDAGETSPAFLRPK